VDEGLTGLKLSTPSPPRAARPWWAGQEDHPSLYKEILKAKIEKVEVAPNDLEGAYVVADVVDMTTGEV
jgi:DNA-directed RNA polymerase subunit beta